MFSRAKLLKDLNHYLNSLNIVYYLLVGIPLILFSMVYLQYESESGFQDTTQIRWLSHGLIIVLTAGCLVLASVWYRKEIRKLNNTAPSSDKLIFFFRKSSIKYLLLCLGNLFPVAGLYLTGEQLFAALYAIALVVFSFSRPTIIRIFRDLKMSKSEQDTIIHSQNLHES